MEHTLSLIVPTVGRPSLVRTLRSLREQEWRPGDELLLAGDGEQPAARSLFAQFGLPGRYLTFPGPARDWGHTPRNRTMPLATGQWLLFLDDDDACAPGALAQVRAAVAENPGRPHLFRMHTPEERVTLWQLRQVVKGNVSTQMIVVPAGGRWGEWSSRYEGDFDFIASTLALWPPGSLVWREEIIAHVWPTRASRRG